MMTQTLVKSRALLEELLGSYFPEDMDEDGATMLALYKINEVDAARMANGK